MTRKYSWERPVSVAPNPAPSYFEHPLKIETSASNLVPAPRAVLYLRVSTEDQTTENQKAPLLAEAARLGLEVVEVIEETASGAKADRPGLERVKALARTGAATHCLVWSLSRLGRSMAGNVRTVLELDEAGCRVLSLQEPWLNQEGPIRQLLIAIFSWVAEQERAQLIERTKAGMARAKAQGKHVGRPKRTSGDDRLPASPDAGPGQAARAKPSVDGLVRTRPRRAAARTA